MDDSEIFLRAELEEGEMDLVVRMKLELEL